MGKKTGIEWAESSWNPIRGCSRVSEGCRNCYAESVARKHCSPGEPYEGLIGKGGQWNGHIDFIEEKLLDPLRWTRPRLIFVNSMSDLFHENVPDSVIDRVFAVMALASRHTFQILTKRPERMLAYCRTLGKHHSRDRVSIAAQHLDSTGNFYWEMGSNGWHLPNVWLGVSIEDQDTANERLPLLAQMPAAVRWISLEPLLARVSLEDAVRQPSIQSLCNPQRESVELRHTVDWVVVGGESGNQARPMHSDWARLLRDQCIAGNVPFLFKQWGEWSTSPDEPGNRNPPTHALKTDGSLVAIDRPVKELEGALPIAKIGKSAAGRKLDGEQWSQYPSMITT